MRRVAEAIEYYATSRAAQSRWNQLRWVISSSSCIGEGEIKILALIRANPRLWDDSHLIMGGDADLLLLALCSPASAVQVLIGQALATEKVLAHHRH